MEGIRWVEISTSSRLCRLIVSLVCAETQYGSKRKRIKTLEGRMFGSRIPCLTCVWRRQTINDTMYSTTMLIFIKTSFPRGLLMIDCGFGRSSDLFLTFFAAFPWCVWDHSDSNCECVLTRWNSQQRDCSGFAPDSLLAPLSGRPKPMQRYVKKMILIFFLEKKPTSGLIMFFLIDI